MEISSSFGGYTALRTISFNGFTVNLKYYLADGADKNVVPHIFVGGWGSVSYSTYDTFAHMRSHFTGAPVYVLSLPFSRVPVSLELEGVPESQLWKAYIIKEVVKIFPGVHLSGYSEGALNVLVAIMLLDVENRVQNVVSYTGINPPGLTDVESVPKTMLRAIKNGILSGSYKKLNLLEVVAVASHKISISQWVKAGGLKEILRAMDPGRVDLSLPFLGISKIIPAKLLTYEGDQMINWKALRFRYSAVKGVDLRIYPKGGHNSIMVEPARVAKDLRD